MRPGPRFRQGHRCGVKMETVLTAVGHLVTSQKIARLKSVPSDAVWGDWGVLLGVIIAVCTASKNKGEERLFEKQIRDLPRKSFFSGQLNVWSPGTELLSGNLNTTI